LWAITALFDIPADQLYPLIFFAPNLTTWLRSVTAFLSFGGATASGGAPLNYLVRLPTGPASPQLSTLYRIPPFAVNTFCIFFLTFILPQNARLAWFMPIFLAFCDFLWEIFIMQLTRDDVTPLLLNLSRAATNPLPLMQAMGNTFKSITEGTFNSVGASFRPIPWAPKADGTPSNLQKTTTMSKSFHLAVTGATAELSNPMPYAAIHQFGGDIHPKGKPLAYTKASGEKVFQAVGEMPARPFFPVWNGQLTAAAQKLITSVGERALARQLGVKN
jgi:phage gpG-like protein